MADEEDTSDYEVGYARPPRHSQFQRGKSGNPRGRPRSAKALKADLTAELGEKVTLREGDKTRRVTKQRALLKSVMAAGLKGNQRAATQIFAMLLQIIGPGEEIATDADLSPEEEAVLAEILRRNSKDNCDG